MAHALTVLGNGFLAHPHNHVLRDALDVCQAEVPQRTHDQLARLAYRLLWLLAAEAQECSRRLRPASSARHALPAIALLSRVSGVSQRRVAPGSQSLSQPADSHGASWAARLAATSPLACRPWVIFFSQRSALPDLAGLCPGRPRYDRGGTGIGPLQQRGTRVRERLDGQALAMVALALRQWQPVLHADPRGFELVSAPETAPDCSRPSCVTGTRDPFAGDNASTPYSTMLAHRPTPRQLFCA